MVWTSSITWATNDDITAARLNVNIRDNTNFLHDPPSCRVFNSAAISVPDVTSTVLTFNSERFDTDTMHSTGVNTGRITFTTAGKYIVIGNVEWAANATGIRSTNIRLNGTTTIASSGDVATLTAVAFAQNVSTLYAFAAADYVELVVFQNRGGALNVQSTSAYSPEFMATWSSG